MKEFSVGINETTFVGDTKITARVEEKRRTIPTRTAVFEARHALLAAYNGTGVESVTIVPGPGYLGLTKLGRFDAVAAAAHVGEGGDGHDVSIIKAMGHDVGAAASAAKSILGNHPDELLEVASVLEERKTISGYDVSQAINTATDRKKFKDVEVFIKHKSGEVKIRTRSENGIVMVPGEWVHPGPSSSEK